MIPLELKHSKSYKCIWSFVLLFSFTNPPVLFENHDLQRFLSPTIHEVNHFSAEHRQFVLSPHVSEEACCREAGRSVIEFNIWHILNRTSAFSKMRYLSNFPPTVIISLPCWLSPYVTFAAQKMYHIMLHFSSIISLEAKYLSYSTVKVTLGRGLLGGCRVREAGLKAAEEKWSKTNRICVLLLMLAFFFL